MLKNKRSTRWVVRLTLILAIIVIIIAINQFIVKKSKALTQNEANQQGEWKEAHTDVHSEYPGLNLQTETKVTDTYTLSIHTPVTKSDKINKSIEKWIGKQKNEFLLDVKNHPLDDGSQAHLNIQVETKKLTEDIYSLVFSSERYTKDIDGIIVTKPFTIDLKNNRIIEINDIINVNKTNLDNIRTLLIHELKKNEELYEYVLDELIEEKFKSLQKLKCSISNKSLTFYFNPYEVTVGTEERIEVNIPIKKVMPFLNGEIVSQLQLPGPKQKKTKEIKQKDRDLDPDGKYIALTFDDGPHPQVTPDILNTLKAYDAKATFFMLGNQVEYYPKIVEQVAKNGHEIGSHSNSHPDLTKLNINSIQLEINKTNQKIVQTIGRSPEIFRPPYGAYNEDVIQSAEKHEYSMILWSVDSQDWKCRDTTSIHDNVMNNINPGAIVLMHDIHSTTAEALPHVLDSLIEEGYEFITVSELLTLHKESGTGPFYGKAKY
ncbi:MAG TPA: polysaccharide deacetylase family protein [Bacillota bacterium]